MFSNLTHSICFYVRFNALRLLLCTSLLAALAFALCQGMQLVAAGTHFWDKFVPTAQIGLAVTLSYLALPYFRHTRALADRLRGLIGKSKDERLGFAAAIGMRTQAENEKRPELGAAIDMIAVIDARAASFRREPVETPDAGEGDPTKLRTWEALKQVSHAYKKASRHGCIADDGAKKRWLTLYFVGGDLIVVSFGALLCVVVHLLSFSEAIWGVYPMTLWSSPMTQVFLEFIIVFWGIITPVYYAYHSRMLTVSLEAFFVKASLQKIQFDEGKKDTVEVEIDEANQQ